MPANFFETFSTKIRKFSEKFSVLAGGRCPRNFAGLLGGANVNHVITAYLGVVNSKYFEFLNVYLPLPFCVKT